MPIRPTRLRVGPVDPPGVSGEVATRIDEHLRTRVRPSSFVTMTLASGYAGYLPDEASYARGATSEVDHGRVVGGSAEAIIVDGAATLLAP